MKHPRWTTPVLLIASLASLSACVPGDFCDVVRGPLEFEAPTAAQIVATDRPTAEAISAQNSYWEGACS